jgi:Ca-activated chloride channel family protein
MPRRSNRSLDFILLRSSAAGRFAAASRVATALTWLLAAAMVLAALLPAFAQPGAQSSGTQSGAPTGAQPGTQSAPEKQNPPEPATEPPVPLGGQTPSVEKNKSGGFTIVAKVNLVVLPATVVDAKGHLVNDLTASDFRVYENSVLQNVQVFKHADIPVSVGIVIDDSGSMKEKRPAVNAAALAFVETSNPQDQVFVVNFNDTAYIDTPGDFASNMEDLRGALEKIDSRGGTALFDAVYTSLDHLRLGNRDKKVLLVITDGVDNESRYTLDELLRYAQESNVVVYTIGLLGEEDTSSKLFSHLSHDDKKAKKDLELMAKDTGGESYFPRSLDEVNTTCHAIAHDIRNQYTLAYYPTNKAFDGTFRAVHVEAFMHGTRKKLIVRTRPGYYAPKGSQPASATAAGDR